jgi:uncharacterized protein
MRKPVKTPNRQKKPINILFSKTRQGVLKATFLQSDRWWYLSELAQHLEVRPSTLQAELPDLENAEFLVSKKDGNRIYYKANPDFSLFHELQQILIKTVGLQDVLINLLQPFKKKITSAFVYGSIARGEEVSISDVDLMIIGDVKLSDLTKRLKQAEKEIEKPINPTVYRREEFAKQIQTNNNFVTNVFKSKKLFLIGNEDELENLVSQ